MNADQHKMSTYSEHYKTFFYYSLVIKKIKKLPKYKTVFTFITIYKSVSVQYTAVVACTVTTVGAFSLEALKV